MSAKKQSKLLKAIKLPKELKNVQFISSENKIAHSTIGSFVIYIGLNIPMKEGDKYQTVISEHAINDFFDKQPYFTGFTRMPATGLWKREAEKSEAIYVFDTTLEKVLKFAHHYAILFDQDAVFVQVLNTPTFLEFGRTTIDVVDYKPIPELRFDTYS